MDSATVNTVEVKARKVRRKPESLSKIKSAARKLFVERGYDSTRPQISRARPGLAMGRSIFITRTSAPAFWLSSRTRARKWMSICATRAVPARTWSR